MSDTSTMQAQPQAPNQPHTAEFPADAGHGRHRGAVSSQEAGSAPLGRHRKPAGEQAEAAA
ncbi:hypothetical protein ACIPPJ_30585 [Streptomyces sp. NPDC086091]|uniref:hypothetical protein n=1 Tax=unclassified Streptomyces TaxID=2593676 RepID=UPI0038018226